VNRPSQSRASTARRGPSRKVGRVAPPRPRTSSSDVNGIRAGSSARVAKRWVEVRRSAPCTSAKHVGRRRANRTTSGHRIARPRREDTRNVEMAPTGGQEPSTRRPCLVAARGPSTDAFERVFRQAGLSPSNSSVRTSAHASGVRNDRSRSISAYRRPSVGRRDEPSEDHTVAAPLIAAGGRRAQWRKRKTSS